MILYTFGLFFVIFISTVLCQQNPFISFISKEQIADIGGTIELKCAVQFSQGYPVVWMRLPDTIIAADANRILPDNRFSVRFEQGSNAFILQIMDLQETDSATYSCKVMLSSEKKVTADVFVGVRRPPIITDDSSRDINVNEGADVTLFCDATGYPVPDIVWRRLGNAILPTGGAIFRGKELKIFKITKKDRGIYVCVAENGMSRGDRRNIAIKVEFKPEVEIPRKKVSQTMLYDMELECNIEAFPLPSVSWIFNGQTLSNDMHYTITTFLDSSESTNTKLRVITIEQKQYGVYQCRASNKLGVDTGEVELIESYVPNERYSAGFSPLTGGQRTFTISLVIFISAISAALLNMVL